MAAREVWQPKPCSRDVSPVGHQVERAKLLWLKLKVRQGSGYKDASSPPTQGLGESVLGIPGGQALLLLLL